MVASKQLQKLENWKLEGFLNLFQFPKLRNWKLEVSPIGDFQFPVSRQANKSAHAFDAPALELSEGVTIRLKEVAA